MSEEHTDATETTPITWGSAVKIGGVIGGIIMVVITAVLKVASIESHIAQNDLLIAEAKQGISVVIPLAIKTVDDNSMMRHNSQEKELDKLNSRTDSNQKDVADIKAQIGVLSTKMDQVQQTQKDMLDILKNKHP